MEWSGQLNKSKCDNFIENLPPPSRPAKTVLVFPGGDKKVLLWRVSQVKDCTEVACQGPFQCWQNKFIVPPLKTFFTGPVRRFLTGFAQLKFAKIFGRSEAEILKSFQKSA